MFAPLMVCSPIHTHPRATELLYVLEGQLYVGFVDTNSELHFAASAWPCIWCQLPA